MNDVSQLASMRRKKNRRIVLVLCIATVLMFGFGYLLVPLYNVLCSTLGINGKTGGPTAADSVVDNSRTITILFLATNNDNLPWQFRPMVRKVEVHPGENKRITYFAKNDTGKTMTVQAVPSVTPGLAAKYLRKTECFCFTQQTLKGHESMEMPLLFHIDRDLPKKYHTITLSYTLFDAVGIKSTSKKKSGRIGG